MILGTTNSPALVAGITEINAASAREEAYKARIAELEGALAEERARREVYMRMWELQAEEAEALKADCAALNREMVHMEVAEAERRARRRAAVMAGRYEQPRRAGGWM